MFNVAVAEAYISKYQNAKSRGKEFSLSLIVFANIKAQTHCAYSGIKFSNNNPMSFERLDNNIGYVDGNVIPVIRRFNTIRGCMSLDEIKSKINQLNERIVLCNKTIEVLNSRIVDSPDKIKKRFDVKTYNRYMHIDGICKLKAEKIESNMAYRLELANTLDSKISKKQRKHIESLIRSIDSKISEDTKSIEKHVKMLHEIFDTSPDNLSKLEIDNLNRINTRNCKELQIKRMKAEVKNLKIVYDGLSKFHNMSNINKSKVKMGLPIDTSTYKTLKHKMGTSLLISNI